MLIEAIVPTTFSVYYSRIVYLIPSYMQSHCIQPVVSIYLYTYTPYIDNVKDGALYAVIIDFMPFAKVLLLSSCDKSGWVVEGWVDGVFFSLNFFFVVCPMYNFKMSAFYNSCFIIFICFFFASLLAFHFYPSLWTLWNNWKCSLLCEFCEASCTTRV